MMKRAAWRRLLAAALVAFGTGSAFGQTCDLQVREGQAAADIDRINRCFNQRLDRLESLLQSAQQVQSASPAATPSAGRQPSFDAGTFSVTVQSARRQGSNVQIVILVKNTTDKALYVALDTDRQQQLLDSDTAYSQRMRAAEGIVSIDESNYVYAKGYSLVPKQSELTFVLRFGSGFTSATANLTLNMFEHVGRSGRRVTAPMKVQIAGQGDTLRAPR